MQNETDRRIDINEITTYISHIHSLAVELRIWRVIVLSQSEKSDPATEKHFNRPRKQTQFHTLCLEQLIQIALHQPLSISTQNVTI
jgi:hypothetical protein